MRPAIPPIVDVGILTIRDDEFRAVLQVILKTKAKIARSIRSAGKLLWLGFDRVRPNRSVLQWK